MPKVLPPVLFESDLPAAELIAAGLDGEMFRIGDGFAPVDQADDARHRARSIYGLIGSRFVGERRTAAWVHGATDRPPQPHEFCVDSTARYRMVRGSGIAVREVVLTPSEIVSFGDVRVTTPRRTALDLVRKEGVLLDADAHAIRRLALTGRFTITSLIDEFADRYRLPGKLAAMVKLRELQAG